MRDDQNALRVAMFTPQQAQCGISDYSRLLIAALRALPDIENARVVEAPESAKVEGSSGGWRALRRFPAEERCFHALGAQLNANVDVAHVQHQYFFFGGVAPHKNHARAFLNAVRAPVVMTVHEIAQDPTNDRGFVSRAIALTNRRNFLHPAIRALIVHTPGDRERLLALGAKAERVHVVTHAVPPAAPMPTSEDAKNALGLRGKRVVTLFGFLAEKKGHVAALDALPLLPPDVILLFAGGRHPQDHTNYAAMLQGCLTALQLQDRVRITGYLDEAQIPIIMAATDVAIAPFTRTSGSGSLANLFAYGRAIVASDIPPHQEIARAFPGCLDLCSPNSTDLAARILAVLEDTPHRQTLQQAALAYAERHSYLTMARQTVEIYRKEGVGC